MLTVKSTPYGKGWGKRAGKHRTWTAEYAHFKDELEVSL